MACSAESVTREDRSNYTFAECEEFLVIDTATTGSNAVKEDTDEKKSKRPENTPSPTHAVPPKQKRPARKRVANEDSSDTECSREKYFRTQSPDAQLQVSKNRLYAVCLLCCTGSCKLAYFVWYDHLIALLRFKRKRRKNGAWWTQLMLGLLVCTVAGW